MNHLFTISEDIWNGVDYDAIMDTAIALGKAGLNNPPYSVFDIKATLNHRIMRRLFPGWREHADIPKVRTFTFRYAYNSEKSETKIGLKVDGRWCGEKDMAEIFRMTGINVDQGLYEIQYISSFLSHTLLALLATKNAEKTTEKVKKHGPKSRKRPREYDYITTIKIGKITETMRSEGDGHSSVRPHLRRGHIRNQRVGKGLSEVKPIFIAPCFINADENWINNQRKEYRIAA